MRRSWLASAALLSFACSAPASPEIVDLRSGSVAHSNADTPPEDAVWAPVVLPDLWSEHRPEYGGSAWYRFEVPRVAGPGHRWGVYLPRVHMNAAVFVNGRWIGDGGSFDRPVAQNWNRPLYFPVAPELFSKATNVVHIRIFSYAYDRGGLWPFSVGPHEALFERYRSQHLWQLETAKTSSLLAIVMVLIVGGIWLGRKNETVYLYFVLAGLVYFVNSLSSHVQDIVVPYGFGRWAVHVAVDWYAILMIIGVHRWTEQTRPRLERVLWIYGIVGSFAVFAVPDAAFGVVSNAVHLGALAIAYYGLIVVFRRWRTLRGAEALIVVGGGLIVAGVCSHGLAIQLGLLPQDAPRLLKMIAPVVMFGFGAVLVARFVRSAVETEQLNRELVVAAGERERILREMHDGVGAHLVSMLALVDDDTDLSNVLNDAMQEMRIVIDSLDPDMDEIPTALGMMRRRLEPLLARQDLRFEWKVDDVTTPKHLGQRGLLHVMRITQESIANTMKHGHASVIEVGTTQETKSVIVTIRDDGGGFDVDTANGGRGLINMRYRANEIHGELTIDATDGTVIRLRIPLDVDDAALHGFEDGG